METIKRKADEDIEDDNIKRIKTETEVTNNVEIITNIIKRDFQMEISKRQEDIHTIQKRLLKAEKTLHLLKYAIIKSFYDRKELKVYGNDEFSFKQPSSSKEYNNYLGQNRIHPAVKKILGKKPVQLDLSRTRAQSQDNNHMQVPIKHEPEPIVSLETNVNKCQDPVKTERIELPIEEDEIVIPIRNRKKVKYEIIIGNISKYTPSNSSQDSSTHKWMMYVRGPRNNPDITHIVKKVRFFLHPSYKPNDVIEIQDTPFHLSRRGWGEFPVRVQIHFQYSINKPVDIIHNLKLDQARSGRQTLGNETVINVWLYSKEISEVNYNETSEDVIFKTEPDYGDLSFMENLNMSCFDEIEFKELPNCNLKAGEVTIKQEQLELNSSSFLNLNLISQNSLQQNNKNYIIDKTDVDDSLDVDLIYLEDHCYTNKLIEEIDKEQYKIHIPVEKFTSIHQIIFFLFKKLPLISPLAENLVYNCCYPYVASSLEEFTSWNIGKRSCSEWYRAKEIKNLLTEYKIEGHEDWSTKFLLMFGRAHEFTPLATYNIFRTKNELIETNLDEECEIEINSTLTEFVPISKLMENTQSFNKSSECEDFEVDIENIVDGGIRKDVKKELTTSETDDKLKLSCLYMKQCAAQIDISLKDEEIVSGISHNSSERVLLQSVMCLAEELIRTAWANKVIKQRGKDLVFEIDRKDIFNVLLERLEFDIFTNEGLGKVIDAPTSES